MQIILINELYFLLSHLFHDRIISIILSFYHFIIFSFILYLFDTHLLILLNFNNPFKANIYYSIYNI